MFQELLELLVTKLVCVFKFTVVVTVALNSVVCQMDKFVKAFQVEFFARSPEVPIEVVVALKDAIY